MKKKSLITMFLSLALVAIIGTGATLAYLSADSNEVKNTFTVGDGYDGENSLFLDEHLIDADNVATTTLTRDGNKYTKILPGDTLPKDPTVHFTVGPDSYIFVKVTGMSEATVTGTQEALFTYLGSTLGGAWEKLNHQDNTPGLNGVYVYQVNGNYKVEAGTSLVPLFTGVHLSFDMDKTQFDELKDEDNGGVIVKGINDIVIQAAAVQFDNVTATDTKTAVQVAYDLVSGLLN